VNVDSEIKLLRNIKIFNHLSQVFLSKTGIADVFSSFNESKVSRIQKHVKSRTKFPFII
jgi:hypothetical protein